MAQDAPGRTPPKKITETLFGEIVKSKEFLVTITSVVGSAVVFYNQLRDHALGDINKYTLLIEVLNIIVLIIGLIIFGSTYKFELPAEKAKDDTGKTDPRTTLLAQEVRNPESPLSDEEAKDRINKRVWHVSVIVYKLLNTLKGFAVCLILLYAFLFITDFSKKRQDDARKQLKSKTEKELATLDSMRISNITFMLTRDSSQQTDSGQYYTIAAKTPRTDAKADSAKRKAYKQTLDSLAGIDSVVDHIYKSNTSLVSLMMRAGPQKLDLSELVVTEIIITIVDNFLNVLSTAFLLMAFYILYHKHVDENGNEVINLQSSNNYWTPLLIAVVIILIGTLVMFTGFCQQNLQSLVVWMRITGGIFNGAGMLLLVSRFISMEYLYKQSDDMPSKFYLIGTTVVLPIYVVIQPLWGIFQVNIENKEVLKQIILMLCLWGKIFFIMITYYMVNNRWLHIYIYLMPVAAERIKLVTGLFDEAIVKSVTKPQPDKAAL